MYKRRTPAEFATESSTVSMDGEFSELRPVVQMLVRLGASEWAARILTCKGFREVSVWLVTCRSRHGYSVR